MNECENDTLQTNEPILMQIGTSGLRGKGWKLQLWSSKGQRSTSQKAEIRFGGLVEVWFLTPYSSRVSSQLIVLPVCTCH